MKKQLSIFALAVNFLLAFVISIPLSGATGIDPFVSATGIVSATTAIQYFAPEVFSGKLMMALQTEVWVPGIKENPVPDDSFVFQSTDMSEHVENNKLHLAEAGIEPSVHENYFEGSENPLPIADISDIPNEVVLNTYSTDQTRHRDLQEVELQYNKKASVIKRHRSALAKNMSERTAFSWSPTAANEFNQILNLDAADSVIDAMIDMEAFFGDLDKFDNLNICLNPGHLARLKKEDYKLYKQVLNEKILYGFKVFRYSKTPIYTSAGAKKPYGATLEAGDKRASFIWATDEVFRCFGDTKMYANLKDSAFQADTLSFAQRALVGKIRANNPKYLGAIL
jgi:hypothetical protein